VPHNGEIYSTAAGLVCFGKQPQAILPQAVVDIGHYRGTEAVSFDVIHLERNIGGTIFDQLARIEEYLWRNTHHGMTLSNRSLERVEIDEYPRAVIRELAVNMLVHRDYTITGSSSRIMFFRNRIEWISPGGLPPGINEDNLLYVQNARNPILRNILYQAGYVESFGQGLSTVVNVLKREDMAPPAFRDVGAAFIVTVFGRSLDTFDAMPAGPYNDAQRRIIVELRTRGELGFLDLREALSDRSDRSLQADIAGLIKANVIERIGKTRAVRYRLRDFRPPSSRQE
jgi:predicted HTH transcriptional regulator